MLYKKVKAGGKEGVVLEVRNGFAKILSDGVIWYPLSDLRDVVIEKAVKGELDDPVEFILAIDAYRLDTEYKFNPYVLASSTKIEIFPHQIDEVTLMLDRPRILLADEVGLGKTIVAALVATELAARGLVKKMLFVVPKALVDKWLGELRNRFEMNAEFLNSEYLKIYGDPFKREGFCFVASMDTLKQDHFLKLLENASFDLVVVDEAHKLSKGTERFKLGEVLAKNTKYMYFLTATPHKGDDEDYVERMRLLDPYITSVDSAKHLVIRNLKDDVVSIDGKKVFPPRESKTVEVPISKKEAEIHEMIDIFIARKLERARLKGDRREINSIRFLGIILRKRASSSLYALRVSLENRLRRVSGGTQIDVEKIIKDLREAEEEFDEEERERKEQELLSRLILPEEFKEISAILKKINEVEKDTKFEKLLEWIERIKSSDPRAKIVVFTEYRDTLNYLSERLSQKYRIAKIDGSMTIEARRQALEYFRNPDGADIMICTDAAGEGIDMQFSNIEINYDLPWNPTRLEQRMGRVHRIGQDKKVFYYNFVLKDTLDGYILAKLVDKIESIKEALGDRVYDVIGRLVSEEDLNELFEELLRVPKERWEAEVVRRLDEIVEERRKILEKVESLITGYRLERAKIEDLMKIGREAVDENEVKRFVEVYVNHYKGDVRRIDDEIYEIILPRDIAYELGRGAIRGTFRRNLALKTTFPYLALGNKVIMTMIKDAMKQRVAAFKHPYLKGFIFFYRISVVDGKGQERFGRFVGITEDGSVVDPKIVWDLEPAEAKLPEPTVLMDIAGRIEEKAREIAISDAENTARKFEEIKEKSKSMMISYYSEEIAKLDERAREYESRIAEAPHYSKLLKSTRSRIESLRKELDAKLREMDEIYKFTPSYELVGIAYVVPFEDYDVKRKVELAGINAVIEYERRRATTEEERLKIRDVSHEFRGYDIESFDRVIEVKSFKTTGAIEMTSNEWIVASRLGDYYWLYVVENALEAPKIWPIKNPVETFGSSVVREPRVEYRYIIKDWKEIINKKQ